MPFCPICKTNHDSDITCLDKTKQVLRDMGIEDKSKKPINEKDFKKLDNKVKIILVLLVLFFIGVVVFIAIKGL